MHCSCPENAIKVKLNGVVFTTATSDEIATTYHELKSRGVHFTIDLVRHDYGKGLGDQEARLVDPDGNEFFSYIGLLWV